MRKRSARGTNLSKRTRSQVFCQSGHLSHTRVNDWGSQVGGRAGALKQCPGRCKNLSCRGTAGTRHRKNVLYWYIVLLLADKGPELSTDLREHQASIASHRDCRSSSHFPFSLRRTRTNSRLPTSSTPCSASTPPCHNPARHKQPSSSATDLPRRNGATSSRASTA